MSMFQFTSGVHLDDAPVATGHVAPVMAWEDTANGRRPGDKQDVDEQGRPMHVVDVLLPLGRDGKPELFGVRVHNHEVPVVPQYGQVEFDALRVVVRGAREGKGVDVSFVAEAVRSLGPQRQSRRSTEGEAA